MKLRRHPSVPTSLRTSQLADRLPSSELQLLGQLGTELAIQPGRRLIREETVGRECLLLLDGALEVTRTGSQVGAIKPGEFVGELALLTGQPRNATVDAEAESLILAFNRREFASMMDTCPRAAARLLRSASKRLP